MSERDWRHVNRIAATNEVVGYYASSEFGKRSEQFRCKISEADYRKAASRAKQIGRSNQTRAQALFDLMRATCSSQGELDESRHHATMTKKKSSAQLDREISEVLTPKRAHATVKTDTASSTTELPLKEKLQQAAKWIRREIKKRDDGSHPSHLAAKLLEEADEKFKLGSYGVEGWAKSPSRGYQYLNYGDPYDPTIVVRSNPTQATVFVALGGWASYAGG